MEFAVFEKVTLQVDIFDLQVKKKHKDFWRCSSPSVKKYEPKLARHFKNTSRAPGMPVSIASISAAKRFIILPTGLAS